VTTVATGASHLERAAGALGAARDHLLKQQDPMGWWKAELQTNVTMDAEDLMLRHFLGILEPALASASARWIRSQQQPDGSWNTFHGGPPDLSTTIEAYVALRLAGDEPSAPHLRAAAGFVRGRGGIAASRVFTRIWLALVGEVDWASLPVVPAEIMFLPPAAPLNIYDFGCWARQTIVALTVVMAHRPARPLPFSLEELRVPISPSAPGPAAAGPSQPSQPLQPLQPSQPSQPSSDHAGPERPDLRTTSGRFLALDRVLHAYERLPRWFLPRRLLRRAALMRAEQWIVRRQEADGLWGGIQPPVVYSIIALYLQGYPLDHPVLAAAFRGLDDFVLHDDKGRRVEACQSPVWDTALAVVALRDAGVEAEHPAIATAARWLLDEEITVTGDWAVRRPGLTPGGWAFEFANDNYPDIDDTAEVVLALRRAGAAAGTEADGACRRGATWTAGMQSRDGGWGAFDADNDSNLIAALPFCDFGEVTDPPSADVTAHVVEMLAEEPHVSRDVLDRGITWLSDQQEADGSWWGRWGVNYVYGTGAAVPALTAAGVPGDDARIRRAVRWLESHQNADGGWGEDLRSYVDPEWRGRGNSTASQTAWALLALIAAGEAGSGSTRRGVEWLLDTQRPDATWDEPWFTGTGFPWDFSINYHLYRLVWPVMALGRYVSAAGGTPP
jgi:squalene-hopene/tetraprenyl-beta-curcumene cyclase